MDLKVRLCVFDSKVVLKTVYTFPQIMVQEYGFSKEHFAIKKTVGTNAAGILSLTESGI